jgi:glycosyltransferase involved in cell wall biosynthesis
MASCFVYVDRYQGTYGDAFLTRQAAALGARIRTRIDASPQEGAPPAEVLLPDARRWLLGVDRRITLVARRFGSIRTSSHVVRALTRELPRWDVAYSFFLWNAHDLVVARRRLAHPLPLVVHAAGTDVTGYAALSPLERRRRQATLRESSLVLCGSQYVQSRVLSLVSEAGTAVHYLGVPLDVPQASPERVADGADVVVLAVARLHPVKGLSETLRAFALARARTSVPLRLEIVGDGPLRAELETLATALRIERRVRFHGRAPADEIPRLMASSHLFVQHNVRTPSGSEEALGGSILEAGAAGLPVVATRSGGVPEAVDEGASAVLVTAGDVDAMADAIVELAEEPDRRAEMGRRGRAFVAQHHDAAEQDARLVAILDDVASATSVGR